MKATESRLLDFLKGPKQFVIPIYQRAYSWTIDQCEQLWGDIQKAGISGSEPTAGHFVGSIVYVERGLYQISTIPQLLVIDGQQRLTTLSLLIIALGQAAQERGREDDISQKKLTNYYLLNNEEEGDLRYKLSLTRTDKATLFSLINDTPNPKDESQRIRENFEFFQEKLSGEKCDLDVIYRGMSKLLIVDISLDRDRDNPQLIFESLNSTGLELTQADLIRNYVLMGMEPETQEKIYTEYWRKMEVLFGQAEYVKHFDKFMRDYLTIKLGSIPNIKKVYSAFRDYVTDGKRNVEDVVADIYDHAKLYVRIAFSSDQDPELQSVLSDIRDLKVEVSYPFLLEVFQDYEKEKISKDELVAILKTVESYVFRRAICSIPTNSLNKTFANLKKEIDEANYLESFYAAMMLKESYTRFPKDEEFIKEFVLRDIYTSRIRNYLLEKLENFGSKEHVRVDNLTIEHILPQNQDLSEEWQSMLGENWKRIQDDYLHTIGNLTLTAYNSEYSDKPFEKKRDMDNGFKDSPLRMNRDLAKLEQWTEKEIKLRGKELAQEALKIWNSPKLSEEIMMQYQQIKTQKTHKQYTLSNHQYLQGDMLQLFEDLNKRIMNLDAAITRHIKKLYIAYKMETNFVDIIPKKSKLILSLSISINEVDDPESLCRDISNIGRWGTGDIEASIHNSDQLDQIMFLIEQAYQKQAE